MSFPSTRMLGMPNPAPRTARLFVADCFESGVEIVDHPHGQGRGEILGLPVLDAGRRHLGQDCARRFVAAQFAAGIAQRRGYRGQVGVCDRAVYQKRFQRAANPGAAHLCVEHNVDRHVEIGVGIDIGVHQAFQVTNDRHPRILLHTRHQPLATARHDNVDLPSKAGEHHPDSLAV